MTTLCPKCGSEVVMIVALVNPPQAKKPFVVGCDDCKTVWTLWQQEEIAQLKSDLSRLQEEKDARVYYQSIVYHVCNTLDCIDHRKAGEGIVCGTAESPSAEVQERMHKLQGDLSRLKLINGEI